MTSHVTAYIQYPQTLLTFFGLWPTNRTKFSNVQAKLSIFEQYLFLVLNGVYIVMMRGDVQAMCDASYLFFTQLALCCRATLFFLNREMVKNIVDMMNDDIFKPECEDHEMKLMKYATKCKNLYKVLIMGFTSTLTWWIMASLISDERRYPYNEIWFPVDMQKSPQYELAYVYEVLAIASSGSIFLSVDTFTVASMLFSCTQLEILREKMNRIMPVPLTTKENKSEMQKKLRDNNDLLIACIKHHQAVKRLVLKIEDTFHFSVFCQLCTAVLIICIIGIRLSQDSPNNASFYGIVSYLTLILSQLYLNCWCGTEITDRSLDFRDWLYEAPWYDQDKRFTSTLSVLLQCTKKPLEFRAGHYVLLARATFVSVLRCSYSYFAVLQQANEG
ncbi:hypothetical protein O3G_MSEX009499 [Manduca sexta]|uniref:Odorant receptor n=1 Tax=Manduca sexta TaxID=7130 RepID=A0A922CRP7_MANSE|nr:hypothetical protein O3G_MSEX009499 [Manduca sexta]